MKEIKVRLYAHENDSFVELYSVISGDTNQKYIARFTWNDGGEWYFVADPLGYCELDRSCPPDYIFTVCDHNSNELFKDSNGEVHYPFPTLEAKAKSIWESIKKNYPTIEGLNDWLLTYLTSEVLQTKLKHKNCPYENWTAFWYEETNREIIGRFEHLGEKYCIYKITRKHMYCKCEWVEYLAGQEVTDEYTNWIAFFGAWFDKSTTGESYSKYTAEKIVMSALKEIYPTYKTLSRITQTYGINREIQMSLVDAAEYLLKGNYDRKHIVSLIDNEKQNRSFYDSRRQS